MRSAGRHIIYSLDVEPAVAAWLYTALVPTVATTDVDLEVDAAADRGG
jgi:hypothetical protein